MLGLALAVLAARRPDAQPVSASDNEDGLLHTGWQPHATARRSSCAATPATPTRSCWSGPRTSTRAAMETVFPFRESERERPRGPGPGAQARRQPGDADPPAARRTPQRVIKHEGQEDFNYGDFYAYTKICSHLGCPTSLYEQRTNRILCPCHQSQFDALQYAKPIFGPATRKLAAAADHGGRGDRLLHRDAVTSSSQSARRSGSGSHECDHDADEARQPGHARGRRRGQVGRRPLPHGQRHAAPDEQGLPDALVVPAGRDRAVQLHRAAAVRHVPGAVLRPLHGRRSSTRARSRTCGAWRCRGPTSRRCTSRSTCAAACSSGRCTTGPRCCSCAAIDRAHVPDVLHRRVPPAA